jgi:hypothetical protein
MFSGVLLVALAHAKSRGSHACPDVEMVRSVCLVNPCAMKTATLPPELVSTLKTTA